MSLVTIAMLCAAMVGTSFLSGIFGMAGGMILIGILLALLPLPEAMMLHGVTQLASNGWRALLWWRHVRWRIVGSYVAGATAALVAWSLWRYVPSKAVALLLLGATPFLARLVPTDLRPVPERGMHAAAHGAACMMLLLVTGVAGPLLDQFFLGGRLDRREILATKSVCQIFGHAAKLLYFGAIIDDAATVDPVLAAIAIGAALVGTWYSKRILEAMSDLQYRVWAGRLITAIAIYYIAHGAYLSLVA